MMDEPNQTTLRGRAQTVGAAFGGAGLAFLAAAAVFNQIHLEYVPYDSIIGPPAFYNFDPRTKILGYFMLTLGPILGALAGLWMARRAGRPGGMGGGFVAGLLAVAGAGGLAMGVGTFGLKLPVHGSDPVLDYVGLIGGLAGICLIALLLAMLPGLGGSLRRGLPRWAERAMWFALLLFHLWLLFEPMLPTRAVLLFAAMFAGLFLIPLEPRGAELRVGFWSRLERFAWMVFAGYPLLLLAVRFYGSIEPDFMRSKMVKDVWLLGALMVAQLALAAGFIRRREGERAIFSPMWLVPCAAMTLYRGCGLAATTYDPYHQGEYIYGWHAMKHGLLPWRDIFYVHGFGFNTMPGWAMDRWLDRAPNLDVYFLDCVTTVGVGVMAWLYLRLWGRRWWVMSLALAMYGAGASPTKASRYLPIYMMALVFDFALTARGRRRGWWLALAGFVAGLGVLWSLDTGSLCVVAGAAWCVGVGWFDLGTPGSSLAIGMRDRIKSSASMVVPFILGGLPVALVWLGWLVAHGMVWEFIDLHLTYAKMKYHNDSLPMPTKGLSYLLSPFLSVCGALALAGIWVKSRSALQADFGVRKEGVELCAVLTGLEEGGGVPNPGLTSGATIVPSLRDSGTRNDSEERAAEVGDGFRLSAMLAFFVLANFMAYLRALDRSDDGHLIYGSLMAWPLLGALVAREGRRAAPGRAMFGSLMVLAGMVMLPLAVPVIRGGTAMVIPPLKMMKWYTVGSREPASVSASELVRAGDSGATDYRSGSYDGTFPSRITPVWPLVNGEPQRVLDFSSQPALYRWCDTLAPSRFYALYYASNLKWQREVIESMRKSPVPWVLWPTGNTGGRKGVGIPNYAGQTETDGIDFRLRNWAVMREALKGYQPDLDSHGTMDSKGYLFQRPLSPIWLWHSGEAALREYPPESSRWGGPAFNVPDLMQSDLDLMWIPRLAGRNPDYLDWGGGLEPVFTSAWHPLEEGVDFVQEAPDAWAQFMRDSGVVEASIEFERPPKADSLQFNIWTRTGGSDDTAHTLMPYIEPRFSVDERMAGPYRIPLGALVPWTDLPRICGKGGSWMFIVGHKKYFNTSPVSPTETQEGLRYRLTLMKQTSVH